MEPYVLCRTMQTSELKTMTTNLRPLAEPKAEYAAGDYLLLNFGNGTQIARVEASTAKRLRVRRLQARGTDNANWDALTSWVSRSDDRILGLLPIDVIRREAPECKPVSAWIDEVRADLKDAYEAVAEPEEALNLLMRPGAEASERDIHNAERAVRVARAHRDRLGEELRGLAAGAIERAAAAVPGVELKPEPVEVLVEDAAIDAETAHRIAELETFTPDEVDTVFGPGPFPAVQEEPVEPSSSPTKTQYAELDLAYGWFNEALFGGELPYCLLTMNRKAKAHGYFCGDRFQTRDGAIVTDEIALNPDSMRDRDDRASLATLVHEMVHLWQHRFGEPPRKSYHDKQWAAKMREVGLIPSSTGEPGGKETGSRVTHYIEEGGRFAVSYERLVATGWTMPFIQTPGDVARAKKQKASKTKFCCPSCEQAAWGKPTLKIICSECDELMVPANAETAGEEA
jgi:hypothetical protein